MTSPEQPPTTNPTDRDAAARLPANVLALGVVSLFNDSAGDMVQPLLPAFVGTIGGGPLALGLIEGIADATASLLQLGSGYLADRIGRLKAATTAGYAVTAIVLFVAYGTFFGLTEGTEKSMVVDLVEPQWRGRALGGYHAAVGVASLPASLVFGVIYQAAGPMFAFSTGAGLAIIAIFLLPRRAPNERVA